MVPSDALFSLGLRPQEPASYSYTTSHHQKQTIPSRRTSNNERREVREPLSGEWAHGRSGSRETAFEFRLEPSTEAEAPSNSNCMRKLNEESKTQSTKKENSPGTARDDETESGQMREAVTCTCTNTWMYVIVCVFLTAGAQCQTHRRTRPVLWVPSS